MSYKAIFSQYLSGRKYTIRHKDVDGTITYETRQDCEPIVEFVKQARDKPKDLEWTHFGEIPLTTLGEWMADGSINDERHVRKYLNTNPAFKIYNGWI